LGGEFLASAALLAGGKELLVPIFIIDIYVNLKYTATYRNKDTDKRTDFFPMYTLHYTGKCTFA
jgi:hypothetical protein